MTVNPDFVRVEGTEPVKLLSCRKLMEEAKMNEFASHKIVCSMNCNIVCVRVCHSIRWCLSIMYVALALRFGKDSHISFKVGMVPKEAGIVPVRSLCCRCLHQNHCQSTSIHKSMC